MLPLRYAVHRTTPRGLAGVVLTHYPLSFCMCKLEYTGGIASTLSTFVEYPFDIVLIAFLQVTHCHIIVPPGSKHTRHGRLLAPHHDVPHRPRFRDAYL